MPFSLLPREEKFFDLFEEAAALLIRAADRFLVMVTDFTNLVEGSQKLREEERACDQVVARIIQALNRSFITPFDREDIHSLATALDDIMDNLEETAHRLYSLRIEKSSEACQAMARIIRQCCGHLDGLIRLCRTMKDMKAIEEHLLQISRLESEADEIYRESDAALLASPPDILLLIKWRELYSWLEETVDACKHASLVISEVVIKGS